MTPENAKMTKLRTKAKKVGHILAREAGLGSCGAFNSKTIMVMRMDITPSLNASIRFVLMRRESNTGGPTRKGVGLDRCSPYIGDCASVATKKKKLNRR